MTVNPLVAAETITVPVEAWLGEVGEMFRSWRSEDSECVSLGVVVDGRRWFVKYALSADGAKSLTSAIRFHAAVRHPAIVPLRHAVSSADGPVLVYPWADGEILYDPVTAPGRAGREAPGAAHARFRSQPAGRVIDAIDRILAAHLAVVAAGFVAVDLYDGCVLYDFARHQAHLCDLDEYRPGPFRVRGERLPGSTRFMAPEETESGSLIDERTTVFNLGRMIEELGGGPLGDAVADVVETATSHRPDDRYASVERLVTAWRAGVGV